MVEKAFLVWVRGGRDRSVVLVVRYGLDGPEFECWWGVIFRTASPTLLTLEWLRCPFRGGEVPVTRA
jgi:hypothetical protein